VIKGNSGFGAPATMPIAWQYDTRLIIERNKLNTENAITEINRCLIGSGRGVRQRVCFSKRGGKYNR